MFIASRVLMSNHVLRWMAPMSIGVGLMYLLDPSMGRRRRALVRDKSVHFARQARRASVGFAQDVSNRATGLTARMRRDQAVEPVDDAVIEARVRTALGRACTHAGAIGVASVDGIVELVGPILASEYDRVWRAVSSVPGVVEIVDNMSVHEDAGEVPGLQGEGSLPAERAGVSSMPWMLAALAGAGFLAITVSSRRMNSVAGEDGRVRF
jgi:hypothetical protein